MNKRVFSYIEFNISFFLSLVFVLTSEKELAVGVSKRKNN